MRVLVACEFSGEVRDAFRRRGHAAWSCDILPAEESPFSQFHHQCDIRAILNPNWWDLLIAHPTCTYICNSGAKHLYIGKRKENGPDPNRWANMRAGAEFFRLLWGAPIPRIAVENPIMLKYAQSIIGAGPSQVIQPWMFGHGETKATCLWLKGLQRTANLEDATRSEPMERTQQDVSRDRGSYGGSMGYGMRPHSIYEVVCLCGKTVTGENNQLVCKECGLAITAEWPCVTKIEAGVKR
jgi:hypothetical protein